VRSQELNGGFCFGEGL